MPLPDIDQTVRVTAAGLICGGGRWSNTWHFRSTAGPPDDLVHLGVLHVELLVFYGVLMAGWYPAGTTLEDVAYTPLDGSSGAILLPGGLVGVGLDSQCLPPEVAEVLTIRTAARGRRARGRIYLPAVTQGGATEGKLSATALTSIVGAGSALLIATGLSGWELGVASYGRSETPAGVVTTWTPFFTPANGVTMDNLFDVQRSRKR